MHLMMLLRTTFAHRILSGVLYYITPLSSDLARNNVYAQNAERCWLVTYKIATA